MNVEHITFPCSSSIRNTEDIHPVIREHFKPFQEGNVTEKIEKTPFTCSVKLENGIAVFDLLAEDRTVCTNVCCFAKENRNTAYLFAKQDAGNESIKSVLIKPQEDHFIITILKDIMAAWDDLPLSGEIELYIYDAIYTGLQKHKSLIDSEKYIGSGNDPIKSSKSNVFKIDTPFPWKEYTHLGDITAPVFNRTSFDIVFSLTGLTGDEINIFQEGEFEVGLFNYKNVPFLCFDFKEYSFDASLNINKMNENEINEWLNANSDTINIFLIDGDSGILKAMRMIRINFMEDIRNILENQTELSIAQTERIINEAVNKYTTQQMMMQSAAKMKFHRNKLG